MARSCISSRSPTRSPTRHTRPPSRALSESRYEIDLDALGGANDSILSSTGLEEDEEDKRVDVVRSDEIEGPEDFTMNMEFWMRTPLLPTQEQEEANTKVEESKEDSKEDEVGVTNEVTKETTEESNRPISVSRGEQDEDEGFHSGSPTIRPPTTPPGDDERRRDISNASIENEEKVMSYLDALPDTDVADAHVSTPLKPHMSIRLHPPPSHPPSQVSQRLRGLQPTVEEYVDTPRKISQDTVIHTMSQEPDSPRSSLQAQLVALEARLHEQQAASNARITELETILSFTRLELETSRIRIYKQSEEIAKVTESNKKWGESMEAASADNFLKLQDQKDAFERQMQKLEGSLRMENEVKLQKQKDLLEKQIETIKTEKEQEISKAKDSADKEVMAKEQQIEELKKEYQKSKEDILESLNTALRNREWEFGQEKTELNENIAALESRVNDLLGQLEQATAEAKAARSETTRLVSQQKAPENTSAQFMDFETRLHTLQTQLDASRADITAKDQEILRSIEEQEQLDQQFIASQKRISELEASISTLRQQLEQARMETSEARVDIENAQEGARVARVGLREARAEADAHINELEDRLKRLKDAKANAEGRVMELENEREAFLEAHKTKTLELRNKAEDAVKKMGAMLDLERTEKKKVGKEIKKLKEEVNRLTAELEKRSEESEDKDEDVEEVQTLHELLRKQVQATKAAKMEAQATRKELESLRTEMETQKEDFKAVNMEMDERLALLLRSITKERAKTAIELRDGQWVKNMERLQGERELMGKVLMREWGKQECGAVAPDENQAYRYLYVKR